MPVRVHRCDEHLLDEVAYINHLPVTSIRRTLQVLAGSGHPLAERALDHALSGGLTTIPELWLFHDQVWTRGRRGIAILRESLRERSPGLVPTESELEDDLWDIIRSSGLEIPQRQYPVMLRSGRARFDLAYPDLLLAIEADSYGWHGDRAAFDADRRRDAEAATLGWVVLRFTWAQIRFDKDYVAGTIADNHSRRVAEMRHISRSFSHSA